MGSFELNYQRFGAQVILISWPQKIEAPIRADIYHFDQKIASSLGVFIEDTVIAYCSLTVFLKKDVPTPNFMTTLKTLYQKPKAARQSIPTKWNIPVCYDLDFGWDLKIYSAAKSLPIELIIKMHTKTIYDVYFLGFLPGFPYLGELDPLLHIPRLETPRLKVPKGSVAIGGQQTGIYPSESPGGWHIIGRTPVHFFNIGHHPPCFLKAGDQIHFCAISKEEYYHIEALQLKGDYIIQKEQCS